MQLLEGKAENLIQQLERQYEISKSAERRAKRMEGDYLSLEDRLRKVEDEAQTGEVLRDELRVDKERVSAVWWLKFSLLLWTGILQRVVPPLAFLWLLPNFACSKL